MPFLDLEETRCFGDDSTRECPKCLDSMELDTTADRPYWLCIKCGHELEYGG